MTREPWKALPFFDLQAALAGAPFVHRLDKDTDPPRTEIVATGGRHPAVFVWADEWVAFNLPGEEELMHDHLRMWRAV